jgi:hypothetical protein
MKNRVEDLRNHLFETLESLRDKQEPMDLDRARAIANVAQVIVNAVVAENEFIKLVGGQGSGFIPAPEPRKLEPPDAGTARRAAGIHDMRQRLENGAAKA